MSGEGALVVSDPSFAERGEIIREKGTNRSRFFRGQVDKYTFLDIGSSYLPSELIAAFSTRNCRNSTRSLQIGSKHGTPIIRRLLRSRPAAGSSGRHPARREPQCGPLSRSAAARRASQGVIKAMKAEEVDAHFHYVPLHSSPAGRRYGLANCR